MFIRKKKIMVLLEHKQNNTNSLFHLPGAHFVFHETILSSSCELAAKGPEERRRNLNTRECSPISCQGYSTLAWILDISEKTNFLDSSLWKKKMNGFIILFRIQVLISWKQQKIRGDFCVVLSASIGEHFHQR